MTSFNESKEKVKIQVAKQIPPPPNLPLYGGFPFDELTYLGRTDYSGGLEEKKFVFGIKRKDRKNNIFILGTRGVGKSKLMEGMIRQDLELGFGFLLFDFDDELNKFVLENIPANRVKDICVFDIVNNERLPAFNPFANVDDVVRHNFITGFLKILSSYFKDNWNPSLEYLWIMIVKTMVVLKENNNFGFVSKLINDPEYRKKIINFLDDREIKNFWETEYNDWYNKFYKETILPINVFLEKLFLNKNVEKMLNTNYSLIHIENLVNTNKVVLVRVPYSVVGRKTANFLVDLILLRLKNAGALRSLEEKEFKDFYIYVDDLESEECSVWENILDFGIEYKFSFTFSNSCLSQLAPPLLSLILNNFGNFIFFKLSSADVSRLEKEIISSSLKMRDTINLNIQEFYIKMTINNIASDFFPAESLMIVDKVKEAATKEDVLNASNRFWVSKNKNEN